MSGYCESCGLPCNSCEKEENRSEVPFGMLEEDWDKMFKSWSWNIGPVEAANELRQKAREWYGPDFYLTVDEDEMAERVAKFFDKRTADSVVDAWHGLEAIGV